jgi:predicted restriction endonuclease
MTPPSYVVYLNFGVHQIQLTSLGTPHNGPDSVGNVLCVCPNCHVLLDYGAIKLEVSKLLIQPGHVLGRKFIDYHNKTIFGHIELPD